MEEKKVKKNSILLNKSQPFLEQKLNQANQLLKKVGLPKELKK